MFRYFGLERFVVIWNTKVFMGWVIGRQQNIEDSVESAFGDIADVAILPEYPTTE
jgi:hypothetical protein